jgi:putative transcriptional regulator
LHIPVVNGIIRKNPAMSGIRKDVLMNKNLKIARIRAGLTQIELAKKAGISNKYLSLLETGASVNPSKPVMERIAKALNNQVQTLFFESEDAVQ